LGRPKGHASLEVLEVSRRLAGRRIGSLVRRIPHTVPYGLRAVSGSSGRPLQRAREHATPPTDFESTSEYFPTLKAWPRPGSSREVLSPSSATDQGKLLAPGMPLPATSAHRVSRPLDGLTPPLAARPCFIPSALMGFLRTAFPLRDFAETNSLRSGGRLAARRALDSITAV
jgi:hypothetical protein